MGNPPSTPDQGLSIIPVSEVTLPIKTTEFTSEELDETLQQTKPGGAVGLDSIPLELWKSPDFIPHLLHFCNRTLLHRGKTEGSGQLVASFPFHRKVTCHNLPTTAALPFPALELKSTTGCF